MWHTLSSRSFHLKNYQSDHVYQLLVILHLFIEYKLLLLGFISTALEIKSSDQLVLHFTRLICDERTQIENCKYSICHVISHLIISIRFTRDEICCSCFSRFTLIFFTLCTGHSRRLIASSLIALLIPKCCLHTSFSLKIGDTSGSSKRHRRERRNDRMYEEREKDHTKRPVDLLLLTPSCWQQPTNNNTTKHRTIFQHLCDCPLAVVFDSNWAL